MTRGSTQASQAMGLTNLIFHTSVIQYIGNFYTVKLETFISLWFAEFTKIKHMRNIIQ